MKFKVMFNFCCNRRIVTEGERTKTNPDKTPRQKPPRTIEIECVQGTFVWDFCTRPTKNRGGGSELCDVLSGGPRMCDKVEQGEGEGESKLAKNSLTYFMDGPFRDISPELPLFAVPFLDLG